MAKRKTTLKFSYDAPVTITFSLVCIIVYLLDTFLLKGYLSNNILCSPTCSGGVLPFSFKEVLSYPRLILYVFSSPSIEILLSNLIFILLLGPSMEERYGSVVIGIMIAFSSLFSGVLTACFSLVSLRGAAPVVFMMIFLNAFMAFSKKKFPMSFVMVLGMFIAVEIISKGNSGLVSVLINVAGGLCGSLVAFLTSPKAWAETKYNKKVQEVDSASPRFKKNNKKDEDATIASDSDETVVGTLKF